jgi:hypothetical protein
MRFGDNIQPGDVAQINPAFDDRFGACFMVVTETRPSWDGLIGYVSVPGAEGGQAYYRIEAKHVVRVGRAEWTVERESA